MKTLFLSILLSVLFIVADAQKKTNTEEPEDFDALAQQTEYLDLLVNNWYVKRSQNNNDNTTVKTNPAFITEETADSVYIKRLFNLPTLIPIAYNDKVKRWIEFYTKNTSFRRNLLGMTEYYLPFFEQVFDKYDLPLELKYMSIIESGLNPRARSRSGAVGLWQFMYPTGKMYGLEINSYVDERMDILKSTDAAARYLRDMYKIFGDWTLSIAAYNSGAGNVKKAIRRSGGKTNFWEIYPYLPKETRGYIPAYIAALYTTNYYAEHNIVPKKIDMTIVTDTVMINKKLHLKQVSEFLKIDFDELTLLNPQYKKQIIPGHYKAYPLRLPFDKVSDFLTSEDEIYKYKDSLYLTDQVTIIEPSKDDRPYKNYSYNYTPPSKKGKKKLFYTIKAGDTYSNIAEWYDVSSRDLQYWNGIKSNKLQIGQKIEVWVNASKFSHYQKVNSMSRKKKDETNIPSNSNSNSKVKKTFTKPDKSKHITYKIKSGDNLWTIAKKYPGVSADNIKKINGFTDGDLRSLKIGQEIIIKNK
ncbi:MAG: transglycosylase SLT domain-containing protein [Bacteroidales bacterium]|nr:transglycosylase SLT domain-containing protein [Bacteroidales bacterium]